MPHIRGIFADNALTGAREVNNRKMRWRPLGSSWLVNQTDPYMLVGSRVVCLCW
jgi:hypothetical protein